MIRLFLKFCQKHIGILLILMPIVVAIGGCDAEEPCVSVITNRYRISFVARGVEGELVDQVFYFDSVRAIGAQEPVFTTTNGSGTARLDLTLNPDADITTYVFYYEGDQEDTLQLAYNRSTRMISPDCGLEVTFSDIVVLKEPFAGNDAIAVSLLSNEILDVNTGANAGPYANTNIQVEANPENCETVENIRLRLGFYQLDNASGEEYLQARNFRRVTWSGSDDVLYAGTPEDEGIDTLDVLLNPIANEVTFVFEYQTEEPDELTLTYRRKFSVNTVFCAPEVRYENIKLKSTDFDSVQILTPEITQPTEQINVKIIDN